MPKTTYIPLKVASPPTPRPISRAAKWRMTSLITVHVLMLAHIGYWLAYGKTVTPVEPSESMETLKTGALNAGFVFFAISILLTLIFGRFVCGWACHFVAYQDLCSWLLKRMGIKPKPLRSRLLMLVPLGMAIHMFVWPVIFRWCVVWLDPVKTDYNPAWTAAFVTEHFWETFPGWVFAILTFTVAGFGIVYFLGNKGFCTYACPYGGVFAVVEKASPLRVRVNESCVQTGECTTACGSNVRVAEEVLAYGMVVDPGCMKCADCITSCPTSALSFGFGPIVAKPAPAKRQSVDHARAHLGLLNIFVVVAALGSLLLAYWGHRVRSPYILAMGISSMFAPVIVMLVRVVRPSNEAETATPPSLSRSEELILAGGFLFFLFAWWGLYGRFPFLMSAGISAIFAFALLAFVRMIRHRDVAFQNLILKSDGRVRSIGWVFLLSAGLLLTASGHSAAVQGARYLGDYHYEKTVVDDRVWADGFDPATDLMPSVVRHRDKALACYAANERWSLVETGLIKIKLTWLHLLNGDVQAAEDAARTALTFQPTLGSLHYNLGRVLAKRKKFPEAIAEFREALELDHSLHDAEKELGLALIANRQLPEALEHYQHIIGHADENAQAHYHAGAISLELGQAKQAKASLERAIELDPKLALAHEQLGLLLLTERQIDAAIDRLNIAVNIERNLAQAQYNLGVAYFMRKDFANAIKHAERATALDPNDGQAQAFLQMLRQQSTRP